MSTRTASVPTVSLSDLPELLTLSAATRIPLGIWGPPGVGKSAIVKSWTKSIEGLMIDIRLSQYMSVDLRGVPDMQRDTGLTIWYPASTLPFKGNPNFPTDKPIVLFLDEMAQAQDDVKNAAFQLIHPDDRGIGEHELMDNVIVVWASNREDDRSGAKRNPAALNNRCMHVNVETNFVAWKNWAIPAGVHENIIGFLNFRPEFLSTFSEAVNTNAKAFSTERAWENVTRLLTATKEGSSRMRKIAVAAVVGEGIGAEFMAFCDQRDKLPSWKDIVADPENAMLPDVKERDILCAACAMVTMRIDHTTSAQVTKYIARMPREYQTMCVYDVTRMKDKAQLPVKCPTFQKLWLSLENELFD